MFYVLQRSTDSEPFSSSVLGFESEKEAIKDSCEQAAQFPFSTMIVAEEKGIYKAEIIPPKW